MLDIVKKVTYYRAFGLNINSDIYFPELQSQEDMNEENTDIWIIKKDLSKLWDQVSSPQKKLFVSKDFVMFQIQDIATFLIQDGITINFSPLQDYDEDIVRIYLLGTCMGSLLMQRKIYPLHGSVVAIDGKAYAFVGESGAGKSTLALTFLNYGYQLLSDDVIAVTLNKDGQPYVIPSYPQQKLWQKSLNEFGMETKGYKSIYGRENKYCVPLTENFFSAPLPLASIFELEKTENSNIEISRISNLKRFQTLYTHTYRNYLIPQLDLMEWHFKTSSCILKYNDMFRLQRPTSSFSAPQLASLILDTIKKEI